MGKNIDPSNLKPTKIYPWVVLVGIALMTATGICTVLANSSLFIPRVLADTGYNVSEFVLWITCYQIGCAIAMTYAGTLWSKVPTPLLLTTCMVVSMVCFAMFGMCNAVWQYYILAAIIGLVGGCYFLVCAPFVIPNWFAKSSGLALGVGGALAAIFTAILTPIQGAIIAALGWRMGYVGVAALSLIIALPFTLFIIRYKPADKGMLPFGYDPEDAYSQEIASVGTEDAVGVPLKTAVRSAAFFALFILGGICAIFGGFGNLWNAIGISWGYDEAFGITMVTVANLFGVLTPIVGFMIDKIKATGATFVVLGVILLSTLLIIFGHTNPMIFLIGIFFFTWYGALTITCVPYIALQIFGSRSYTKICSYLQIGVSVIGAVSAPIVGLFFDLSGTYDGAFTMALVICIVAIAIVAFCVTQQKKFTWKQDLDKEVAAEKAEDAAQANA